MENVLPDKIYQNQLTKFTGLLTNLLRKRKRLGWFRLIVFLVTIAIASKTFIAFGVIGLIPTIIGVALLLYFVSVDVANNREIKNVKTLIQLNEEELAALNNQFQQREEGAAFTPVEHPYANDLDIFGKSSIYQWLSRCYTEQGKQQLAHNLLQGIATDKVLSRQKAVNELYQNVEWRQQWQAYAMQTTVSLKTEKKISDWLDETKESFTNPAWKYIVPLYSIFTLSTAIATALDFIPITLFSTLYFLYLITSLLLGKNAIQLYSHLNGVVKETATLQALIDWIEYLKTDSGYIKQQQSQIKGTTTSAGKELKQLKNILDRFDLRNSLVGLVFFNAFLLWDVRQIIALNQWRKRNKTLVKKWFDAVAEIEVIHSLSTLRLNQPAWCFPEFTPQHFTLQGSKIGHPLLADQQRVNNDFTLYGIGKIGLITGSNMAGKSTFLRSLGVNIVLAQIGSPVCASSFTLSPVQLVSSMRIADNLAENTSTFYAELKKLRSIIELVNLHRPVFILLDEILRGTNSFDRHKGSAALIRQLIKEDAVAVIATHDVELAQIQLEFPYAIENYHFDVEVEGEELYFDYKIKKGVCKSLNASILMKKIGIDLSE